MLEEQDLMAEIEKNRQKHSLVSTDDVNRLVSETTSDVKNDESNTTTQPNHTISKYDAKRDLNNLITKCEIIIEVIDARDPISYRSKELEINVLKNKDDKNKKLILLINKTDLVSTENAVAWGKAFRRDIPTILFSSKSGEENISASINELIDVIKALNIKNKKPAIGFVGYPNTGKQTVINIFKNKFNTHVRSSAIQGANEVVVDNQFRFVTKFGVIQAKNEVGMLMPKTTKDVDDLKMPVDVVKTIVETIPHDDLLELYEIVDFNDHLQFLENIAKSRNFKVKKGHLDIERAARFVVQDVIEGKIKFERSLE